MTRSNPYWTTAEMQIVRRAIADGLAVDQTIARLPSGSLISVILREMVDRPAARKRPPRPHKHPRRYWSEGELQIVRDSYAAGETPAATLARLEGRRINQVYAIRQTLGLSAPLKKFGAELDALIRAKHAEQWCDTEIRDEWNRRHAGDPDQQLSRETVSVHRRKLGLPSNALADRLRQRVAAKTREQIARSGLPSMAHLRLKIWRDRIVAMGWPADLRRREAEILTAIWDHGPMTKNELARRIGMPVKGSRNTLCGSVPGGTYTASLMRRGLLIKIKRAVRTGRKGGNVDLYSLPLNIERRKVSHDAGATQRIDERTQAGTGQADDARPGGGDRRGAA